MNIKERLMSNVAALKMAKIRMDDSYTPLDEKEQIEVIRKWSGCGRTKGVLNDWNASKQQWIEDGVSSEDVHMYDLYQDMFEAIRGLFPFSEHKKVMESVRTGVLSQFFTPEVVCRTFYDVLSQYLTVTNLYEPSAGSGVFITTALEKFPEMKLVELCEKDKLTNKLLSISLPPNIGKTRFYIQEAFEDTDLLVDGVYDVLATNPPYGDFGVYDTEYSKDKLKSDFCKRIHNYFVAKSIDKVRDGGVCAWLITNAFLDTVSNRSIRKHLFSKCDFISLTVMPDNLMFDTGGTNAPSHFLVVQKNSSKSRLSPEEELLVESSFVDFDGKKIACNKYIYNNQYNDLPSIVIGNPIIGKNQYGKPSIEIKWNKPIEEIAEPFREILSRDFDQKFKKERTLVETFQELGKIMGASLQSITYAEDDPCEQDVSTCVGCGVGMFDSEPFCYRCKQEGRTLSNVVDNHTNPTQGGPELKELLPEYIPFKNGIIVEK